MVVRVGVPVTPVSAPLINEARPLLARLAALAAAISDSCSLMRSSCWRASFLASKSGFGFFGLNTLPIFNIPFKLVGGEYPPFADT